MRKILSIFAAMLVAFVANAAVINITNETPDALRVALNGAADGDEIVMAAGTYVESNSDYIAFTGKSVTVRAAEGAEVILQPKVPVRLKEGATATFVGIKFDCGHLSDASSYENLIVPADDTEGKGVVLQGCEFYNWTQVAAIIRSTTARRLSNVTIIDCYFHDVMKSCLFLENTNEATVQITNSTFAHVSTSESYSAGVIDIRATSGSLLVDHCTFYDVHAMNTDYAAVGKVKLTSGAVVSNCIFAMPEAAASSVRTIRDIVAANNCLVYNYTADSGYGMQSNVTKTNCVIGDPLFVDAANNNFTLSATSPALTMNDGQPIGDPRWIPSAEPALADGYYLNGTFCDWNANEDYLFVQNPATEGEYMLLGVQLEANAELKVVGIFAGQDATWYPDQANNYVISAAGTYDIYFRPDGQGGDDWYYHYFYVAVHEDPQPAEAQLWKVTPETPYAANSTLIDDDLMQLASVYLSFVSGTNHTYGEEQFAKAFQIRAKNAPTEDNLTGEENETTDDTKKASPLVLTAKEDIEVTFYYRQQQTADAPAAENDNKDLWIYDQAAITAKLTGTHTSVDVSADSKYAFVTKKMTFTKNHVYTLTAVGTTLPLFGIQYQIAGQGPTAISNTEMVEKAVKMIENGQLIIIKNGVRYNVMGMQL